MDYDAILEHLGETGKYNVVNICLIYLPSFLGGMMVLAYSLAGMEPDAFRCRIPQCPAEDGEFSSLGGPEMFPPDENGDPDYCKYYPVTTDSNGSCSFDTNAPPVSCNPKVGFVYDQFAMDETVATELDLVCQDQFKVALVGSIYMSGLLVSSFVFGWVADQIGRRSTMLVSIILCCGAALGGSFTSNYAVYCVTRFFTAMGAMGGFSSAFILAVELSGNRTKTFVGIMIEVPFAIGEAVVAAVAMGVSDWRTYQIVTSAPLFLIALIVFVIPESPRWLLKTGKYDEFVKIVQRAAKFNKVTVPEHLLSSPKDSSLEAAEDVTRQLGISALFATWTVSKITVIMWTNWIVVTIGYYGISLGIGDIGSNVIVNFVLVSLIEIPSYIFSLLTVDHLGRKFLYVFCILLTGICCIPAAFLEEGAAKTTLALIGKFGAAAAFAIIYLYTAELYPTEIRSTAVGLCSTFSRVGGIAAPQIAIYLPTVTFDAFPMLFMGICSLVGGLLALFLPETLGSPLVETLGQLETLGQDAKPLFSWWSKQTLREHQERIEGKNRSILDYDKYEKL